MIAEGVKYLRIVACSYIIMGITNVYLYVMRSIERVIVATVCLSSIIFMQCGFNAIFILVLFGFPALGIRGAASCDIDRKDYGTCSGLWLCKIYNKDVNSEFTISFIRTNC